MAKLVLNDITSGYASITALNDNFARIENALENTLSRDGTIPNTMSVDLDMNGRGILNVTSLVVNGVDVSTLTDDATAAAASAAAALVSENNAAASEVAAKTAASQVVDWEYLGAWVTTTPYKVNNIVYDSTNGASYICLVDHTSNATAFSTDLELGRWGKLAEKGDAATAAALSAHEAAADPHPNYALDSDLTTKQPLDATLTAIADETLGAFSHRNKIINGKMEIAQRGTSFTDLNDVYTLDRWKINIDNLTGAAWSVTQNTAAQDAIDYGNLLRYSVTTVGSMTFADIRQPIEDVRTLQGKQVTVSFLLRYGAVGKTITAQLEQNFGSGGSAQVITTVFTATGSINAGFTRYSGTVTLPSVAGKTIGAGNNLALVLKLTAPDAGDYVDVTHVQLEEGSVATPFEHRPYGAELALCQRYYQTGRVEQRFNYTGEQELFVSHALVVPMRVSPTLVSAAEIVVNLVSHSVAALSNETINHLVLTTTTSGGSHSRLLYAASAEL